MFLGSDGNGVARVQNLSTGQAIWEHDFKRWCRQLDWHAFFAGLRSRCALVREEQLFVAFLALLRCFAAWAELRWNRSEGEEGHLSLIGRPHACTHGSGSIPCFTRTKHIVIVNIATCPVNGYLASHIPINLGCHIRLSGTNDMPFGDDALRPVSLQVSIPPLQGRTDSEYDLPLEMRHLASSKPPLYAARTSLKSVSYFQGFDRLAKDTVLSRLIWKRSWCCPSSSHHR